MRNIKLIIPMSGIGKRFIDAGYDLPKFLINVNKKPIIEHVVNLFPGILDVHFICNENHLKNTDLENILKKISNKCIIHKVPNENRKGPVDAVLRIIDNFNDTDEIIISYCDYGTEWDFNEFLNITKTGFYDGLIPSYIGFHPHMLGSDNYAFSKVEQGLVKEIREKKPFTENKMNEYASNGTYYFKNCGLVKKYFKKLVEDNISINGEFYVSLVYNNMIHDGFKIGVFEIQKMLQWGTPYDLEVYKGWLNYFNKLKIDKKPIYHPKNTTLILPMAGRGSRFSELGYDLPKPLLPIKNNFMVVESVNCLPETDKKVFICLDEHVKKYSIDNKIKKSFINSEVIVLSEVTEGQACTCEIAIKELNINLSDPILISACDNGVYYNNEKYQSLLDDETVDIIVWSFRNNQTSKLNPNSYAWLDVDNNDNIHYVSCKKFIYDDPLKTHAIIGTMFFRKGKYFIDGLNENYIENIRTNNEFYVDDVLNQCVKQGLNVKVFESENYICWGTPNDFLTYNYWEEHFKKII
jgi:NDP-sugar pyrophosphorylase family protein